MSAYIGEQQCGIAGQAPPFANEVALLAPASVPKDSQRALPLSLKIEEREDPVQMSRGLLRWRSTGFLSPYPDRPYSRPGTHHCQTSTQPRAGYT